MKFTIQRITEEDLQCNPSLKNNGASVNKDWVVNESKDTFLYFLYADRWDMGGTRDEWWRFCYQGHCFTIRIEPLDLINSDGVKYLKLLSKDIQIAFMQFNSLKIDKAEFMKDLNEAFSIYKSYGYSGGKFQKKYNFQVEIVDRV